MAELTQTNLVYPIRNNQVLLGMKKRKMGKGNWNGFGGKLEAGETITESAVRELQEECGLECSTQDLEYRGSIQFYFAEKTDWNQEVHIYVITTFENEPQETEEMLPKWFDISELPYDQMWVTDKEWLPKVLAGEEIHAEIHFSQGGKVAESVTFTQPTTL